MSDELRQILLILAIGISIGLSLGFTLRYFYPERTKTFSEHSNNLPWEFWLFGCSLFTILTISQIFIKQYWFAGLFASGLVLQVFNLVKSRRNKKTVSIKTLTKWQIQGKTAIYTVCLDHDYISGKATIILDGEVIYHRPRKWIDFGLKQRFTVDDLDCLVYIMPTLWFTFWYRLYVDGKKYDFAA